jgi:ubiquinone/menaquinone biosynthesis C-methylase UbiE
VLVSRVRSSRRSSSAVSLAAPSDPLDEPAARAAHAYDAAADTYDAPANGFWEVTGRRTVERLALRHGARVLDLPCGSGASALAAAEAVGRGGAVVAVDLAAGLLELARAKAKAGGLSNVEFVQADMRATGLADESFDAVICVFGIFFVPDREALMQELWRLVVPGGVLAVTTWGPDVLEPGASAFWDAVASERPDLVRGFNPWDDLVSVDQLVALYHRSGIDDPVAELVDARQQLRTPDDWWQVVMGSGFRGTVEALDESARVRVRTANLAALGGVASIRTAAVYGTALKPA